jgi:hypothetical protein
LLFLLDIGEAAKFAIPNDGIEQMASQNDGAAASPKQITSTARAARPKRRGDGPREALQPADNGDDLAVALGWSQGLLGGNLTGCQQVHAVSTSEEGVRPRPSRWAPALRSSNCSLKTRSRANVGASRCAPNRAMAPNARAWASLRRLQDQLSGVFFGTSRRTGQQALGRPAGFW